jgi:hypothetical protein
MKNKQRISDEEINEVKILLQEAKVLDKKLKRRGLTIILEEYDPHK